MNDMKSNARGYLAAKKDREENFPFDMPCKGNQSLLKPCQKKDVFKIVELVEVYSSLHLNALGKWETIDRTRPLQSRKQYIHCDKNLDPNMIHPEYGRCIRLKARIKWIAGTMSKPLNGRTISWSYQKGPRNKSGLLGTNKEGFDNKGGPATKITTTDTDGWTPEVKFYISDPVDNWRSLIKKFGSTRNNLRLSQYDGDTFEIAATNENKLSMYTGYLTVVGLIDWLPGVDQMRDTQIPSLAAMRSIPNGIVLHSGQTGPGVAEYLQNNPNSCHLCWSSKKNKIVQQVPLDLRAHHAETEGNSWWGYEWPGPYSKNPRSDHEWEEFERFLKKDTGLLHLVSGGHLKYFTFHSSIDKNKKDPGPGVPRERVEKLTGLTYKDRPKPHIRGWEIQPR